MALAAWPPRFSFGSNKSKTLADQPPVPPTPLGALVRDFVQQLALVLPAEELEQRVGKRLEPRHDVLAGFELARHQPAGHLDGCLLVAAGGGEKDEAFPSRAGGVAR